MSARRGADAARDSGAQLVGTGTVQSETDAAKAPLRPASERRGLLFVLSSPSGAGKSTIARRLLEEDPGFVFSVSATTRPPREGEVDGREYHFVSHARFEEMVQASDMLEHARVFDHRYGTPRAPVEQAVAEGRDVLFDVDWQGAQQIRYSDLGRLMVQVSILPPSIDELERRLRKRAQDSDAVIRRRMLKSRDEISHWGEADYVLINDDLERCYARVRKILAAERLRTHHQRWIVPLANRLYWEYQTLVERGPEGEGGQ